MTVKAAAAKVDLGFTVVDGLIMPDGTYAMAIRQLADLVDASKNTMSRDIKRLLGESFDASKVSTEFRQAPVNVISLTQLMQVLTALARKGSEKAWALLDAAALETFERRFDKAFDIKRTEEERNARLKTRLLGKQARRSLTDCYKAYCEENGETPNYAKMTAVTLAIIGLKPGRDDKTEKELMTLTHIEMFVAARLSKGYDYFNSLKQYKELCM